MNEIFLMGLATDYCVKFSALDARQLGFDTRVIEDGCRGIDLHPGDVDKAFAEIRQAGAVLVSSGEAIDAVTASSAKPGWSTK